MSQWTHDELLDYRGWKTKPIDQWNEFDKAAFYEFSPTVTPQEWFALYQDTIDYQPPKTYIGQVYDGIMEDPGGAAETFADEYQKSARRWYGPDGIKGYVKGWWSVAKLPVLLLGFIAVIVLAWALSPILRAIGKLINKLL